MRCVMSFSSFLVSKGLNRTQLEMLVALEFRLFTLESISKFYHMLRNYTTWFSQSKNVQYKISMKRIAFHISILLYVNMYWYERKITYLQW